MKKKGMFKKLLAGTLSAAMMLGMMATTAFAYVDDPDAKGSITIHKFTSMTTTGDHADGEVINDTTGFGTAAENVEFSLKAVTLPILADGEKFTATAPKMTLTEGVVTKVEFEVEGAGGATSWKAGTIDATVNSVSNGGKTNAQGELVFGKGTEGTAASDLAQGYYLLEETKGVAGYAVSAPAIISIPLTNRAGDAHLYDIHIYPKNVSDKLITKTLDGGATTIVSPDTDFTWTINAAFNSAGNTHTVKDLKNDAGEYGSFVVKDTPSANMSIVSSVVKAGNTTLTAVTDYTYDETEHTWTLTNAGIDKAIAANATGLTITVTTKFNSFGTDSGTIVGLTNKASSTFKPVGATDPDPEVPTDPVNVPKANIEIVKKLSQEATDAGKSVAGIKFLLATKADVDLANAEVVDNAGTSGFVLGADKKPIIVTTGADGKAVFEGLTYDKQNGNTYYLIEYKTNEGLQLKKDAIEVKIPANQGSEEAKFEYTTSVDVINYLTTETDPDNPTFQLPLTGGTGTVIFTIVAILCFAGAVVVIKRAKRRKA